MEKPFPLNTKIGQIQGLISLLKEHGDELSLEELSDESFQQIDDLVNILDACRILGFIKIQKNMIVLNKTLEKRNSHEINHEISRKISGMEPFSIIIKEIRKNKGISTTELFHILINRGLISYRNNMAGIEAFKRDLLVIGIRLNLISYDHENDVWHLPTKRLTGKN